MKSDSSKSDAAPKQLLFVCTGNICRSPMAEAMLRHQLPPGSPWRVASAGTSAFTGDTASHAAIAALDDQGMDLRPHRSQTLHAQLVRDAQVIVALTRSHRDDILDRFPAAAQKVFLLKSFDPAAGDDKDVPDPIGSGRAVYCRCRDSIAAAIPGLVEFLDEITHRKGHAPT